MRRKPYSVVLLDEIEKAHPDVFNILLQVLDEGHLTDNYGRVIDFKNTVVIMTSNVGARDIMQGKTLGFHGADAKGSFEKMQETVKEEMNKVFNPEFLNRLDDVIVFHPLDQGAHRADRRRSCCARCSAAWATRSSSRRPRSSSWSSTATTRTTAPGRSSASIQRYIEDPLSEKILIGEFGRGDEIEVDVAPDGERLAFRALTGTQA